MGNPNEWLTLIASGTYDSVSQMTKCNGCAVRRVLANPLGDFLVTLNEGMEVDEFDYIITVTPNASQGFAADYNTEAAGIGINQFEITTFDPATSILVDVSFSFKVERQSGASSISVNAPPAPV